MLTVSCLAVFVQVTCFGAFYVLRPIVDAISVSDIIGWSRADFAIEAMVLKKHHLVK